MNIFCTRPGCPRPDNVFADLNEITSLKTAQQKYCTACGMPLILDGRYLPERLLGKGGFGAAFLACDRRSPTLRKCVVKQFQPANDLTLSQLETAQKLFEREAVVLDRLGNQHPQIPNLLAYFPLECSGWNSSVNQQFFYIVQDYIDGQDLEAELADQGRFSENKVREVLEEILNVLQFVHDQDVIHRDIKPSNIMRDRQGRLYLLDFGAVKQVTQQQGSRLGTSTGIFSMGYAPPEQMRGHNVFPSTDLYALAVTCIVLLTGKDCQELYDSHKGRWNWKNQTQVSNSLAYILDKMLQPTPSDRFASAELVLKALNPPPSPPPIPPLPKLKIQPISPISVQPKTSIQIQTFAPAPSPSPAPSPPPAPPAVSTPPAPPASFQTINLLKAAAFTGFEITLLRIAVNGLLGGSFPLLVLILGGTFGGLVFAQYRRWIETKEQIVLALFSLGLVIFIPLFGQGIPFSAVIIFPVLAALGGVAAAALFRLIYLILYRFL
ncbi:protein kinase domain-containing protein [Capilliphycus salinus ALCB114379]|uniref:protein kinase domain-containing protein n=1 Tax=Capilliphycus salinus TaxID=2768948 RepID=UPI0039A5E43B